MSQWKGKDWRGNPIIVEARTQPKRGAFLWAEMKRLGRLPEPQRIWVRIRLLHFQLHGKGVGGSEEFQLGYLAAVETLLTWMENESRETFRSEAMKAALDGLLDEDRE